MREQSFSNPRREENGAERHSVPEGQPEGASGGERKAELGEVPTSNEGVGKDGRVFLHNPERSEAFLK